jgi:hypothetical protein
MPLRYSAGYNVQIVLKVPDIWISTGTIPIVTLLRSSSSSESGHRQARHSFTSLVGGLPSAFKATVPKLGPVVEVSPVTYLLKSYRNQREANQLHFVMASIQFHFHFLFINSFLIH